MATTFQASTPPPPSFLHTPPTPRHGKGEYQPYSPRRKSSRVSQQSQTTQTTQTPPRQRKMNPPHSPNASNSRVDSSNINISPSSPQTAPKRRTPKNSPTLGGRRVSGALDHHSTAEAASALGLHRTPRNASKMEAQRSALRNGMLPTPGTTPQNQTMINPAAISSVARNLFPIRGETVDEVMPSPKKKGRKKYTGFTLDSFEAEEDGAIAIYTDSHDRVPEVDMSPNNPFYGESSTAVREPTKRSSKRRKIVIPGEEAEQTIAEAEQRADGLVYVFRGKKLFRKFKDADMDDSGSVGDEDFDAEIVEKHLERPLTRSSIKPRLLFPTPKQIKAMGTRSQVTEDEEEAVTDIEDPSTLIDADEVITTPKAPRFAPASPPNTARVTRSKDVIMSSPAGPASDDEVVPPHAPRGGKLSPFDGWAQTKHIGVGKKRGGEPLAKARGGKKTRA